VVTISMSTGRTVRIGVTSSACRAEAWRSLATSQELVGRDLPASLHKALQAGEARPSQLPERVNSCHPESGSCRAKDFTVETILTQGCLRDRSQFGRP
jgi:hypothetical protein